MYGPTGSELMDGMVLLDHFGVMEVRGEDAVKFLHGQLTQDLVLLPVGQARLAAYCTPKGRMLASFVLIKESEQTVLLVCSKDLVASTLKRLSMFVMRAKVKIEDVSALRAVWGRLGQACDRVALPVGAPAWSASVGDGGPIVELPAAGATPRQLMVGARDAQKPVVAQLGRSVWDCSDVLSGVAHVVLATSEAFVPQMLNYESVGGVNFKKGCYPGQEVVARSQFRGTLKRRTFLVKASGPLTAAEVVGMGEETDVGLVVLGGACTPQGPWFGLVCIQTSAATQAGLWAGERVPLELMPLPYALLEDV